MTITPTDAALGAAISAAERMLATLDRIPPDAQDHRVLFVAGWLHAERTYWAAPPDPTGRPPVLAPAPSAAP